MKKVKVMVVSGETVKNMLETNVRTLEQIARIADRIEEKENRSMAKALWDGLTKKPVWGKREEAKNLND